ncbi:MAG: hypothetical protein JJT78_11490 [Leptospira sp.]|nr:hypothetical protein [Leptospira sp.]
MTPIRAVQSFIDAKKEGIDPPPESIEVIKNYKKWKPSELIGLQNASAYYPEIYFEENMDKNIDSIIASYKAREVKHKF